jgi:LacI family transcriptional regulator
MAAVQAAAPIPAPLFVDGEFTELSGEMAAKQLLSADPRPTAIFAFNDRMALGAVVAATRLGLEVPGDVSIVGFDDTPHAIITSPGLTTVRQPVTEMARAAVDLLVDEHGLPPRNLTLPFEIVRRGSVGRPGEAAATA